MVSYMWPDKLGKFQKTVQGAFSRLDNQYLLKVISLSTIIAVDVSICLWRGRGDTSFKLMLQF